MKRSVNLRRKSRSASAKDLLATYRRLGMSDEEIKDVLQEVKKRLTPRAADGAACPDCKVLVFEGEETYFYCARHQPIKESE